MINTKFSMIKVFVVLFLLFSLTACSLAGALSAEDPEPNETSLEDETEDQIETDDESNYLSCPIKGESLVLGLDHTITIQNDGVNLNHILHAGMLPLFVTSIDLDGQTNISSGEPIQIPYEMMGTMRVCEVEAQGIMLASASGFCIDGVLYLTIIENWQPASGTMTCEDEVMSFQTPGPGAFSHEGEDGSGEVFYLVPDSEGYTILREFGEGSGYHSWTLYASEIPTVPLVPSEP